MWLKCTKRLSQPRLDTLKRAGLINCCAGGEVLVSQLHRASKSAWGAAHCSLQLSQAHLQGSLPLRAVVRQLVSDAPCACVCLWYERYSATWRFWHSPVVCSAPGCMPHRAARTSFGALTCAAACDAHRHNTSAKMPGAGHSRAQHSLT